MKLRPYQSECLDAVAGAFSSGCSRQLIVLPTAGGKTLLFSQLPSRLRMRRPDKMLVLVQADELAYQAVDKLQKCNPTLRVGLEKAQYKSRPDDDIVVASVQTLGASKLADNGEWNWSKRLRTLDRDAFRYVVCDETHHILAPIYHGPLRYFKVFKQELEFNDTSRLLLGVTATPNRSDNKGLEAFYDRIVYSRDIRSMIKDGWLATPEAHRVDTMANLDGVDVRRGDYVTSQLEKVINVPERNNLIIDKYLEIGEGAPFLAFTCDIQHTVDLTEAFRARGIECYGIASANPTNSPWLITKENDRKTAIEKFNNGEFSGLLSCSALLEGFDAPRAMVGLDGAPTTSTLRFTQKFGRVLRPYPAPEQAAGWTGWKKRCAIWIDFVDSSSKHNIATAPTLFGLRPDFNAKGKKIIDVVEEIEKVKQNKPAINLALYTDLDAIRGIAEKIDLFAVPTAPPEIQKFSSFSWLTGLTDGSYQLVLPDKGVIRVQETTLGAFEVSRHVNGIKTMIESVASLKLAIAVADKQVPREAAVLLNNTSAWRNKKPTDPQIACLAKVDPGMRKTFPSYEEFKIFVLKTYSCGEISSMISAKDKREK